MGGTLGDSTSFAISGSFPIFLKGVRFFPDFASREGFMRVHPKRGVSFLDSLLASGGAIFLRRRSIYAPAIPPPASNNEPPIAMNCCIEIQLSPSSVETSQISSGFLICATISGSAHNSATRALFCSTVACTGENCSVAETQPLSANAAADITSDFFIMKN